MRLVGYRLLSLGQPGPAAHVFDRVRLQRPFEPHAYRDLARSLELSGRFPLAAVQYEVLMGGRWHQRFHDSILVVVRDEYRRMLDRALRSGTLSGDQAALFAARRKELVTKDDQPVDLRVTASWNTDGTDVDLWVVEPGGEACGYDHKETKSGGKLLDDLTSGYGPERYQLPNAPKGEYVVLVNYYSANANLIASETHVEIVVERLLGKAEAESKRFHVVLTQEDEAFEVCKVRF